MMHWSQKKVVEWVKFHVLPYLQPQYDLMLKYIRQTMCQQTSYTDLKGRASTSPPPLNLITVLPTLWSTCLTLFPHHHNVLSSKHTTPRKKSGSLQTTTTTTDQRKLHNIEMENRGQVTVTKESTFLTFLLLPLLWFAFSELLWTQDYCSSQLSALLAPTTDQNGSMHWIICCTSNLSILDEKSC